MKDIYDSTRALSVYNALSLCGRDMTRAEILAFLRDAFDSQIDFAYVERGINFLVSRGFVADVENIVTIPQRHPVTRRGRSLVRMDDDQELEMVTAGVQ